MARFVRVDKRIPGVRFHPRRKPVFEQNLVKITVNGNKTTYNLPNGSATVEYDARGEVLRVVVYE